MARVYFTNGASTANLYLEASDVTWPDVGQFEMQREDQFDNAFVEDASSTLLTFNMTMSIGSRWDPDSLVAKKKDRVHNDSARATFDPTDYWDTSDIERAASNVVTISVNFLNGYSASISYVIRNKPLPPSTPTDVYAYCSASDHNASDPSVSYYTETDKRVFVHFTVPSDSTSITKNVERSMGGGDWVHILTSLSTGINGSYTFQDTNIPLTDGCQVRYRVQASNSIGESGYGYSKTYTFKLNKPPNAPETITVPSSIRGGSNIQVSWPTSTDPEGNGVEYELERQWDGAGDWTQIYTGKNTSFSERIPNNTYTSVTYRVRAYDTYDSYSSYTTSPTREIDNNSPPTISGSNSDLGTFSDTSPSYNYTVNDVDASDTLTVTESLDNVTKRTFTATRNQQYTLSWTADEWLKILNGNHTARIVVSDGQGGSATRTLTFTKGMYSASVIMSEPIAVDAQIKVCVVSVSGNIPADAEFKVEVTNNGKDTSPAWEDATEDVKLGRNHVFTNATQTNGWAFNVRVTAARGASDTGGNIVSIQGGFQ